MRVTCKVCGKYLGEIRDAKLHKKIVYLCDGCDTKRIASGLAKTTKSGLGFDVNDILSGLYKP